MSLLNALRRHSWKIIALLVAGFVCVALTEGIASAREAARRSQCRNNLKQIGLALHNYHDTHGCFPPAITYGPDGKPWHSWRVLLVPYLEASPFWSEYKLDEPWNGPHNSKLAKMFIGGMPTVYHCPTDSNSDSQHTSYVAVIGEKTMWPPHGVTSMQDVSDGTSNTLLVVEVSDSGVHWMEPRDLRLDTMSLQINSKKAGVRSRHEAGANVAMGDGLVPFLNADTPPKTVRSMLEINDGKPAPVEAEPE